LKGKNEKRVKLCEILALSAVKNLKRKGRSEYANLPDLIGQAGNAKKGDEKKKLKARSSQLNK
jgi:hypothetical protein